MTNILTGLFGWTPSIDGIRAPVAPEPPPEPEPDDAMPPPWDDAPGDAEPIIRRLPVISAADLLSRDWPEPPWVVREMLPTGLTILAGRPKVGKSWLALQLTQAVATGGVFLGERVDAGRVLYLALEDPPRRLAERMRLQGWPVDGGLADFVSAGGLREVGYLNLGGAFALADSIRCERYRLVIVDTLARAVSGDLNDARDMTTALAPLQELALAEGCAVVLVDHHNKMGAASSHGSDDSDGADLDPVSNVLGSTAKAAMADCLWGLYKRQGVAGATLAIVGRDVADRRLCLKHDPVTHAWQLEGDLGAPKLTDGRQRILDVLGEFEHGLTCSELAEVVGRNKGAVHHDLSALVESYDVRRQGDAYSLNE